MKDKKQFEKLMDDVHYLIVAHCKYNDMSMYDRALKQFQEDINYGQLEEMSYDERFAFLLGFENSLKAIENAIALSEELKKSPDMIESLLSLLPQHDEEWKMKCPYKVGDEYWILFHDGTVDHDCWDNQILDRERLSQGCLFPTEEAAELEAKRRNLLTRFRAFRDECNGDWKVDWSKQDMKYFLSYSQKFDVIYVNHISASERFNLFGYFKNEQDTQRAVELFGDEIKELFVECD